MIVATDVGYRDDGSALAAAVGFAAWDAPTPAFEHTVSIEQVAPYEPGQFYRRELPCLLSLLADLPHAASLVVVDGHVWLRPGQPGLGMHLYDALGRSTPVVGIAKRAFRDGVAAPVCRGASKTALHVSTEGIEVGEAVAALRRMHGPWRIPTLLRRVDTLSRGP